jgi:hypothetical protein
VQKTVAWGDLGKMEPYLESMHSHKNQLKIGLNSVPIRPLVAEILNFLLLVFVGWRVERVQIIRRRREVAVENKYSFLHLPNMHRIQNTATGQFMMLS